MPHTKREVWEAAKAANLDGFIAKVSKAFGNDAIADVCIQSPDVGDFCTSDAFLYYEPTRIACGVKLSDDEIKQSREASKYINRLKK